MLKLKLYLKLYLKSILGGVMIGIGGMAFLSVGGGVAGALLFSVGLLSILIFDFNLFTGKICYVKWSYDNIADLLYVLSGNILGALLMGDVVYYTRPDLAEFARKICEIKLSERWLVLILGALCNILIFLAVDAWKRFGFYASFFVVLCVMVFILSGFEHSIANIFYMACGCHDVPFSRVGPYLIMNVVGNSIGGIIFGLVSK